VPGCTFRVFVTSCAEAPEEIWRDYHRRADMENRIAELKHDLGADGFCLKESFATEAAFRAVPAAVCCPPVGKLGRTENKKLLVGQHLELANPNFAEVGPCPADLSLLNVHGSPKTL
jgi:hypothetical protein